MRIRSLALWGKEEVIIGKDIEQALQNTLVTLIIPRRMPKMSACIYSNPTWAKPQNKDNAKDYTPCLFSLSLLHEILTESSPVISF